MGLLDEEENRASFGFFPQMQPRRRLQDVQGSANLPVDVTRGRLAGLLGLIPDVLNFMGRSPMPTETFGETQYNPRPQLPYDTDFYLKNLPLAPTSRAGQVAGQAASFVPLNPAPLVRAGVAGAQALAPTAARMTEGFMQRQGFMPSVVPAQPSGLLTPEIPAPKPQAPVSDLGFYSAAEQAAMNLQRGKGTGQSFLNDLMKAPDVKKDELQYTGLDDFLKDKPNVTRQEVQDFIAGNRVDVQERQLSGRGDKSGVFSEFNPDKNQFMVYGEDLSHTHAFNTAEEADNFVKQFNSQIPYGPSKYDKYQSPGGENYRELLLTLPEKTRPVTLAEVNAQRAKISTRLEPLNQAEYDALVQSGEVNKVGIGGGSYQSSHFNEPNILAHMRVNDRVDADGKKMLLIEEVQSDWHQAGREKGYQGKGTLKELPDNYFVQEIKTIDGDTMYVVRDNNNPGVVLNKDYNKQSAINGVINELNATSAGGVPDAPFKDTWHQLALKRALKEAVDKGYDRIGLTTGKQQADRYKLSNEVDEINVTGRTNMATGEKSKSVALDLTSGTQYRLGVDNNGVIDNVNDADIANFKGKKLSEVVGKDIAKQIMEGSSQTIKGEGLNIGGEGMKKYYDEIYPAFLNKQGKKYGAQVGEVEIGLPPKTSNSWAYFRDWFAENHGNVGSSNTALSNWEQGANNKYVKQFEKFRKAATQTEKVRYLDITPEMRKAVQKGQPLFTAAPIGGIGTGLLSDEQRKELSGLLGP